MSGCSLITTCDFNKEWMSTKFQYNNFVNKKINFDGYYISDPYFYSTDLFLFYDDGTCGYFQMVNEDSIGIPNINLSDNISRFGNNSWSYGGCYSLKNDSLIVYSLELLMFCWELNRLDFVIIDEQTIKLVNRHHYSRDVLYDRDYYENKLYHFIPSYNIPDNDYVACKYKKWTWEFYNDWKAYRQRMKQKRKELRKQNKQNK